MIQLNFGDTLEPGSYPVCNQYSGIVPSGETIEISCANAVWATTVVIQIPGRYSNTLIPIFLGL